MARKLFSLRLGFTLLAGATLAMGVLSLRLLQREEYRLADESRRVLRARVDGLADDLQLAVQGVENEVMAGLASLPAGELAGRLARWPDTHPLVRNTFIWNPVLRRLEWPDPATPTTEEKGFIRRYEHLFSTRLEALQRAGEAESRSGGHSSSPRLLLQRETSTLSASARSTPQRHGWIPWFDGDQLFLLGWMEREGRVVGVELEMTALLARLIQVFPRGEPQERAWALLDGVGAVMYQAGGLDIAKTDKPAVAAGLGAVLPHWQVVLFTSGPGAAGEGGSVRLASALLLVALLASILAGGGLILWEAGRQAREARQKTTFVANVSHELKTPLTTLRLYAELLREGRVKGEDRQRHYLDVMIAECSRLGRLVNNMLDFSRLEQKRRVYAAESLDLKAWLAAFLEPQRIRLREVGLELRETLPREALAVRVDRDALEQAVLNLLDNAAKYAASGKVVELRLVPDAGGAMLEVLDRGPGVPESLRERIFENFFRVNASLTARVPGSGLGLSIARRLLRDQGGELLCLPRDGGGACFRILLRST